MNRTTAASRITCAALLGTLGLAPEQPPPALTVERVIVHRETRVRPPSFAPQVIFFPYVLFDNGRAWSAPDQALTELDEAASARASPSTWGNWRESAGVIEIEFDDGNVRRLDGRLEDARAVEPSTGLSGTFEHVGGSSSDPEHIGPRNHRIRFEPSGIYEVFRRGETIPATRGLYGLSAWSITLDDGMSSRGAFLYVFGNGDALAIGRSAYARVER